MAYISRIGFLIKAWSSTAQTNLPMEGAAATTLEAIHFVAFLNIQHLLLKIDTQDIAEKLL